MTHLQLQLELPAGWLKIETIDMHTGGEPLRVIVSGLPAIAGRDVLEKRRHFRQHLDHLRTGLMFEHMVGLSTQSSTQRAWDWSSCPRMWRDSSTPVDASSMPS